MTKVTTLEKEINTVLEKTYHKLLNDKERMIELMHIYKIEVEKGFYEGKHEAEGEPPSDRRPNEAFMKAAEDIWATVEDYLKKKGLYSSKTLRELFKTSREYDLPGYDIRIFIGHLVKETTKRIVILFVLYIPHDNPKHTKFNLPKPFYIRLLPIE